MITVYRYNRSAFFFLAFAAAFGRPHLVCVEHGRAITLAFPLREDGAAFDRPGSALLRDDFLSTVVKLVLPLLSESHPSLSQSLWLLYYSNTNIGPVFLLYCLFVPYAKRKEKMFLRCCGITRACCLHEAVVVEKAMRCRKTFYQKKKQKKRAHIHTVHPHHTRD